MQPRDLFGVTLRVLGIWLVYCAGESVIWLLFRLAHAVRSQAVPVPLADKMAEHAAFVSFYLLLAFAVLVCADGVAHRLYAPKRA